MFVFLFARGSISAEHGLGFKKRKDSRHQKYYFIIPFILWVGAPSELGIYCDIFYVIIIWISAQDVFYIVADDKLSCFLVAVTLSWVLQIGWDVLEIGEMLRELGPLLHTNLVTFVKETFCHLRYFLPLRCAMTQWIRRPWVDSEGQRKGAVAQRNKDMARWRWRVTNTGNATQAKL